MEVSVRPQNEIRTGFGTDERKSRFFIGPIHLLIVYSGAKLIFVRLTSTCRGRVFSLNSKEITVNLLAVISVYWNEKFSSSLFLSQDFLLYHNRRGNMLFAQTFMQSRKANRQSKVGVVNSVFSFAAKRGSQTVPSLYFFWWIFKLTIV